MSKQPPQPVRVHKLLFVALVSAVLLSWPALLLNHAPLIFSDTTDYLSMGIGPERPIHARGYAWFAVTPAWIVGSLWPVVMLQSLMTAGLVHAAIHTTLPELGVRSHLGIGLGLAVLTTAPWAVSYVMPDALTAPALLGLFLVLALPTGPRFGTALAASVVSLATASHLTHLLTALAVVSVLGLWRLTVGAVSLRPGRLVLAATAAVLGAAAVVGVNVALTGHAEYTRGGGAFLAARLAGDGLLQRYLARACPDSQLPRFCAVRDRLPHDADDFLWLHDWLPEAHMREGDGVFDKEWEAELAIANRGTLRAYWPVWMSASLGRTFRQFITMNAGDGLSREIALYEGARLAGLVSPASAAAALASRQAREELAEHPLAALPGPLALAAVVACLVGAIGWARPLAQSRPTAFLLLAVVVLGAVTNAGAVGFGGVVHARYQSRIAWLFPLAAGMALAAVQKSGPSPGFQIQEGSIPPNTVQPETPGLKP